MNGINLKALYIFVVKTIIVVTNIPKEIKPKIVIVMQLHMI